MKLTVFTDHRMKVKEDKKLDFFKQLKKLCNIKLTGVLIIVRILKQPPITLKRWTWNQWDNSNHSDHSSSKIGLDTWKLSGDPRRYAATQTPEKKILVKVGVKHIQVINHTMHQNSHQKKNNLCCTTSKILSPIKEIDKGVTQTNGPT